MYVGIFFPSLFRLLCRLVRSLCWLISYLCRLFRSLCRWQKNNITHNQILFKLSMADIFVIQVLDIILKMTFKKMHWNVWWHICNIVCQIIMSTCNLYVHLSEFLSTCHIIMSTCKKKNISTTSSYIFFYMACYYGKV